MLATMLLPFSEILALILGKEVSCIRTNGRFQFSQTSSDSELSVVRTEFLTGRQGGKLSRQNILDSNFTFLLPGFSVLGSYQAFLPFSWSAFKKTIASLKILTL